MAGKEGNLKGSSNYMRSGKGKLCTHEEK
jgi:hypothetical protein